MFSFRYLLAVLVVFWIIDSRSYADDSACLNNKLKVTVIKNSFLGDLSELLSVLELKLGSGCIFEHISGANSGVKICFKGRCSFLISDPVKLTRYLEEALDK